MQSQNAFDTKRVVAKVQGPQLRQLRQLRQRCGDMRAPLCPSCAPAESAEHQALEPSERQQRRRGAFCSHVVKKLRVRSRSRSAVMWGSQRRIAAPASSRTMNCRRSTRREGNRDAMWPRSSGLAPTAVMRAAAWRAAAAVARHAVASSRTLSGGSRTPGSRMVVVARMLGLARWPSAWMTSCCGWGLQLDESRGSKMLFVACSCWPSAWLSSAGCCLFEM